MKDTRSLNTSNQTPLLLKRRKPLIGQAFIGLALCSVSVVAQAADANAQNKPAFTLSVVTHGEGSNRSDNLSEVKRQDNRRTDVSITKQVQVGTRTVNEEVSETVNVKVRDSFNRSVRLNDGGVIWVTKDPASLTPVLNVTAPQTIEMHNGELETPMTFEINTNYAAFINSWELQIFNSDDEQQRKPIAKFIGDSVENGQTVKWDGSSLIKRKIKAGDQLSYVLKVKDKHGHVDRTVLRELNVVGPNRNIQETAGTQQKSRFENNLELQTIPIRGSRVRIFGRDIPTGNSIKIDNENISLLENKFVIEKLLPEGQHSFDLDILDNNNQSYTKSLNVKVKTDYMFAVALADITAGEGKVSGNLQTLGAGDSHLDGDLFVDGRLAFYLKGKVKGKYLITAQADTGTAEVDELFNNFLDKDPESLFRRLDPEEFYPVYGDDSTIIDDTNSQGKLYVRVEWDKSKALWGNYNTDITGTELSSFNRGLYGAKLDHRSTKTTKDGDHKTDVTVFASEAQSAFRHNEFLGTGGSLYYLKDTDIVDGSEKVWIEIRQSGGERVLERITLEEGRDYQIDDFQGRIILNRALLQIAEQNYPSLIKDTPLDGDQVYLIADYEYVPDDFNDNATYGARGKAWVNDNFAVGGTFVNESRVNDDYELRGLDFTLKKTKGTFVKVEYAESESTQTQGSFASDDGGLNFNQFDSNTAASDINGSAFSIEGRADLEDFSSLRGSIGAWFKERDAGFSTANLDTGNKTTDLGVEAIVNVNDRVDLATRITQLEREILEQETEASLQADYKVNDRLTLSGEVKYVKQEDLSPTASTANSTDGEGTLAAIKVGYDVNQNVNLYGILQGTLSNEGAYESNDLLTLGVKAALNNKLDVRGEFSTGDLGNSVTIGADYRVSDTWSLYNNFTLSTDRTNDRKSAFTIGQRKSLSNRLNVYTEHQFTRATEESGVGHTFGLDYQLSKELTANASVQTSKLDKVQQTGLTDRQAFSVGLRYKEDNVDASTRFEYRRDKGTGEDTEQFVTTNNINYRLTPSWRLQGRLNYSRTEDQISNIRDAEFTEASVGFAYRPIEHDRLNILGRLTYLYDLQPLSQSTDVDEKSLIASLESSYQINQRWELGGKLAHRLSEIREDRADGDFSSNDATLASARVRYHLTHNWDATAQYHWLSSDESQDAQHGALLSVDRHVGKNLKLGIGYNFTDFDDDLRNEDGTAKGWFINLVGKY